MTNSLPKYENYKASGVEWLGEIPEHWEVKRLKYVITVNNGLDFKHIQTENGYPVIGSGGQFAFASDYLYDGEVILLGRKGTIDKPLYFKGKFWAVDTMFYSISKRGNNTRFLFYVATTIPFKLYSTATALPSMTQSDINDHKISLPPLQEQTAIASFIDQKTAKLDQAIAQKVKLIALLKERRQILIHNAVTKGLNSLNFEEDSLNFEENDDRNTMILNQSLPNQSPSKNHQKSKFRHSGVDWIGEIPEHWEVKRLKYFVNIQGGFAFNSNDFKEEGVQIIKIANTYMNELCLDRQPTFVEHSFLKSHKEWVVKRGDILMSLTGTLGKKDYGFAILINNDDIFLLNQRVAKISVKAGFEADYILNILQSEMYLNQLYLLPSGTKQANLSNDNVINIKVPFPSNMKERRAIISHIISVKTKTATAISLKEKEIEKLKEYKATLINSAVSGKIKVSNYA